ncbi:PDZ domain-containing protein [Marinicella sp. W31]|uniref:S41 family peptidase n=1 Tax=Marinicella sp. W31 TaxID=3023713 RepID=UPI00375746AB
MNTPKIFSLLTLSLLLLCTAQADAQNTSRLLRFPDIHQNQVTFVYAGDIYIANINDGQATRLTSHHGFETFPKFSRDGKKIAFAAEFTGTRQVYVMNTDGSDLKQLTWYNDVGPMPPRGGFDYRVLDFSADNQNVLVRGNRLPWGVRMGRPYLIPLDGGLAQPLQVPETGGGMLSPDGTQYLYTPIDREFRTWKRYRGGRAQDVWVYDLENNSSRQLTTDTGTDNQPVWVGEDIYFLSDRNYTLNLYRYRQGNTPEQITQHDTYDALWASAGPTAIVYENNGFIWRYQPSNQQNTQLNITIPGNRQQLLPKRKSVVKNVESADISPDGKRVVMAARGAIFTVPAESGEIRQLSRADGSRDIDVAWSPDGQHISYLNDASGEYELYIRKSNGTDTPQRLTEDGSIWRFTPVWSPDSRYLAYADKNQTLWIYDIRNKRSQSLDRSNRNDITDYSWSPDSRWVTYTKNEDNGFGSVWVYNIENDKSMQLTDKNTNEFNPIFDSTGHYLFFLSNRDYNLAFSSYEFNYLYNNATRIYAARLNDKAPALYPFKSDEAAVQKPTKDKDEKDKKDKKSKTDKPKNVVIDAAVVKNSVIALPAKAGNYATLQTHGTHVFVLKNENNANHLMRLDLKEKKEPTKLLEKVNGYQLAAQGKKVLVRQQNDYAIIDATAANGKQAAQAAKSKKLNLKNLTLRIDPRVEWQQMYVDGWRILRDWFYDPGLHGNDWDAIRAKYQPWADAAAHRTDLDYIFGEIAGELNAGHIYVNSGDQPSVKRQDNGLLGAEFSHDASGYFKIDTLLPGENWHDAFRSPLTEPGVDAKPGDYIISINGISTTTVKNIYQLLEHQADRTITLVMNDKPEAKGGRTVYVKPIKAEHNLRYLAWVQSRMEMVDKLSNGRIGYVHLPNTAGPGNRELFKQFLPQITKDALIIDDRYNGGGFIPDRMIELLSRKTLNYWKQRGLEPNATPFVAHDGPKAMLINGQSSSGGDALPYYFRKNNLGPIIGTRTWGGLIGISGNPGLADGGSILASTFRFMSTDGEWAVENVGVSPDIEVIDRPELVAQGRDPSLERAVEELLKSLEENPRKSIKAPPAPAEF